MTVSIDPTSHLTDVMDATAAAVATDVSNGQVVFQVSANAHDAVASTVSTGKYAIEVDEPAALGGGDTAPNPVEYFLASLLGCHVVAYRFWADKLGIALDDVKARAEGDLDVRGFFGLDDSVRPGFSQIRTVITVTGPETEERYRELHDAVEAHCPVLDMTVNATPVSSSLEVVARTG